MASAKRPMNDKVETKNLLLEVQDFASSLGLAAAGNGFNDRDFRPKIANKRVGDESGLQTKAQDAPKQIKKAAQSQQLQSRVSSHKHAGPSKRADTDTRDGPEKQTNKRPWNKGSSNRPGRMYTLSSARASPPSHQAAPKRTGDCSGEKTGKSLIGKGEPAIWHEAFKKLDVENVPTKKLDDWGTEKLRSQAEAALENEVAAFEQDLGKNRQDAKWLQQVRQSGTTADKLAALTLLIQESALANFRAVDELLKWVSKRSGARAAAGQAVDALRELFCKVLLPDRKLLFFEEQPLGAVTEGREGQRMLLFFYGEDAIKKRYAQFVGALKEASTDSLEFIKEKAVKAIFELLRSKPEQEAALLAALVNKLGDPSRKLASHAGYLLGQLLEEHPAMSLVVVRETEAFLFSPRLPARAVYYGVVFLNQIVLSQRPHQGGSAVAKKLIDIYFTLFQLILEGKLGHASELRAQREDQAAKQKPGHKNIRRPKHKPPAKPTKNQHSADDREVDGKLLGGLLAGVRRAFPFVEATDAESLMEEHSGALFRIIHSASFAVAVQALSLLFQLLDARSAVSDRFYRALYGALLVPEAPRSSKAPMFLSLLYKALKADVSHQRTTAFIKRLLQVAVEQLPNYACGCLLLTSELLKEKPALWGPIVEAADHEGEHFQDLPDEPQNELPESGKLSLGEEEDGNEDGGSHAGATGGYDIDKRDPLFCKAEQTCVWELVPLAGHVHPSVAAMAKTLLAGMPIKFDGDPLRDLSITAFLDKFVQKKPKARTRGSSLMQPLGRADGTAPGPGSLPSEDSAPDTAFFHKFFQVKAQREAAGVRPKQRRKKPKAKDDSGPPVSDEDSPAESDVESEEADDFMDLEENLEDTAAPGGYAELAAAMAADSGEDSGADADGVSDGDDSEADGGNSEEDISLLGSDEDAGSEIPTDEEVPEDTDVFALAGPSDEESEDEDAQSASDSDLHDSDLHDSEPSSRKKGTRSSGSWVFAAGAAALMGESLGAGVTGKSRLKKAKHGADRGIGDGVFASADEYAEMLDQEDYDGGLRSSTADDHQPAKAKSKRRKC